MTEKNPQTPPREKRPLKISERLQANWRKQQTRFWRQQRRFMSRGRYWVRCQRAFQRRDLLRGQLVAHRRMFGVSHKSVQPGEIRSENEG